MSHWIEVFTLNFDISEVPGVAEKKCLSLSKPGGKKIYQKKKKIF